MLSHVCIVKVFRHVYNSEPLVALAVTDLRKKNEKQHSYVDCKEAAFQAIIRAARYIHELLLVNNESLLKSAADSMKFSGDHIISFTEGRAKRKAAKPIDIPTASVAIYGTKK